MDNSAQKEQSNPKKYLGTPWTKARFEGPNTVLLTQGTDTIRLLLQLHNPSAEAISPTDGVSLSCRILGPDPACPLDKFVVPLPAGVAPGEKLQLHVPINLSKNLASSAWGVRIGLQHNGTFAGGLDRQHPKTILFDRGEAMSHQQKVLIQASKFWGLGNNNGLSWPESSLMFSEHHKLLYLPIAKCACTSIKILMMELSGIEGYETAIRLGIHRVTDRMNTGVQLKDLRLKKAREILASPEYFSFCVLRDPAARLLSAYLEKFVYNRMGPANLWHTGPVMAAIQGRSSPNLETGISFAEFVGYITSQQPESLDAHWRPQSQYLQGIPGVSRMFQMERLEVLESCLSERLKRPVQLKEENTTVRSHRYLPRAYELKANELEQAGAVDRRAFFSAEIEQAICRYYETDFGLHRQAGK